MKFEPCIKNIKCSICGKMKSDWVVYFGDTGKYVCSSECLIQSQLQRGITTNVSK